MEWRERSHVIFDNSKDKIILFTRRRKFDLGMRLAEARITVRVHTRRFNTEATLCLGVYLEIGLQFRTHKNLSLEKAPRAEDRIHHLRSENGLAPGLVRKIQVAAVQAVPLYGAELW